MEKVILENSYEYAKEREQSQDFLFVYNVKRDFEETNLKTINVLSHWHREIELNLPGSSGTFSLDSEKINFEKDDILVVGSEHLHSIQTDEFNPFYSILIDLGKISYNYSLATGLLKNISYRKLPTIITKDSPTYTSVHQLCNMIIGGKNNNDVSQDTLALLSITLVNILYESGVQKEDEDMVNERIKKTITYISEHYKEKITIEELCNISYMSESHFIRTFKKKISLSPIQYINELRLEKAYELLKNGHSVIDASTQCGFNNQGYFIRQFKKKYNLNPSMVKEKRN